MKSRMGGSKRTLLNASKSSARNSSLVLSRIRKVLNIEMSQFTKPGDARMSRPDVPNCSGGVRAKAFGSNQYSEGLLLPKRAGVTQEFLSFAERQFVEHTGHKTLPDVEIRRSPVELEVRRIQIRAPERSAGVVVDRVRPVIGGQKREARWTCATHLSDSTGKRSASQPITTPIPVVESRGGLC